MVIYPFWARSPIASEHYCPDSVTPRLTTLKSCSDLVNLSRIPSQTVPLTTRSRVRALCPLTTAPSSLSSLSPSPALTPAPAQMQPPPHHIPSSDSESDTPSPVFTMTPNVAPLYAPAEVKQASPSSAPLLSVGCLTIKVICQFETVCRCYFSMKSMAAGECIGKIIYNFKSTAVQSWINTDEAHLVALTFPEFLIAFKKKFLPCSWEDELIQDQIVAQNSTDFVTWVNNVRNANDELGAAKSLYHIPDNRFHLHLIPRLSDGMKRLYKANNGTTPSASKGTLDAITDFEEWME